MDLLCWRWVKHQCHFEFHCTIYALGGQTYRTFFPFKQWLTFGSRVLWDGTGLGYLLKLLFYQVTLLSLPLLRRHKPLIARLGAPVASPPLCRLHMSMWGLIDWGAFSYCRIQPRSPGIPKMIGFFSTMTQHFFARNLLIGSQLCIQQDMNF